MGRIKEHKGYKIKRHRWKFWRIDELEFTLPAEYGDAFIEVIKETRNEYSSSLELKSWVIEDVREALRKRVCENLELVKSSQNLSVTFYTRLDPGVSSEKTIRFYVDEKDIYFDSDKIMKRDRQLKLLGL